ncbi:sporulation protein [Nonomuraea sp. NPDC050536]|uniref:sporulation protein n=1 Tax=Nonomuraea sp. NPDC050536 TaxID=3364366 RepID=UPI0037C9AF7E
MTHPDSTARSLESSDAVEREVAIAQAVDKGDLDAVAVEPLPSQARVMQAFLRLGFHFKSADVEAGRIYGVHQELPFYQEIEFHPPRHHAGHVNEVELTFVASPRGLEVVLEADKRGSGDAFGRFQVTHEQAVHMDWESEIERWLSSLPRHGFGHHHHEYHEHHDGPGWGSVAAAGAAGLVGGLVVGEIFEEIFDGDDGGDGDW